MFQFLGIILVIAGLAILVIKAVTVKEDRFEEGEDVNGRAVRQLMERKSPDWMINLSKKLSMPLLIMGIFVFLIPWLWFFADRGYNYLLVHPGGKMTAIMEQGIHWRGFAKIDRWDKWIDVKVVDKNSDVKDIDAIEGVMNPIPIRFIDQVTANAKISARFQLPKAPDRFIDLAVEFKSLSNLIQTTLIPTVKEIISNTGYMFAAQDYISGEAQNFRTTFEEQLSRGSYVVNKITSYDTIYETIDDVKEQRAIKTIKTNYTVKKVLENGVPKRVENEITKNGIIVSQVVVDDVILEEAFKKRLEAQRDESAKRQLEQQKIKTAKDAQARIIAEGERDKAAERVSQEKDQVKKLIAIETRLKEEQTNKELAAIALETQKLQSQKLKVKADAEAYEIQKKVHAGITPERELEMKLNRDVKVAAELAKTKWPEVLINGKEGGNSGTSLLYDMLGADYAKKMTGSSK